MSDIDFDDFFEPEEGKLRKDFDEINSSKNNLQKMRKTSTLSIH